MFGRSIQLKTPEQFALMRQAGLVVAQIHEEVRKAIRPGVTTAQLDDVAEAVINNARAIPNFKGYHGYPAVICTSVNEEVVHGIPQDRILEDGDVISIDAGAIVSGWHGDAAFSIGVGEITADAAQLLKVTEESLWQGIAAAWLGSHVGDIGFAIEKHINLTSNFGIVEGYTGHGIGTEMHMDPVVPNQGPGGRGNKLKKGMALAIEPMVTMQPGPTWVLEDEWTVVAESTAAHFEHTVAITPNGLWVLTAPDGGKAKLAELGIPYAGD